ncbi:site-specific integrase [Dysgonomonas sp. Marseille-P4677]|uniref:site-specific integrase n=1 Tax=Dysgonomonas sp. Marseille-P4677 TaxID=2364790 RepID=UPI001913187F|nr:site-specific integrase [Dysgonomonas sp. Marseille-P4677]MBK5719573.1 site-specific integrase [Dysgonomonas sp. Marseille-P4677]
MKKESFSVLFFIAKKRLLKNGEAPVYLRITVNGIPVETRIKRSVLPSLWNQAKECSRGRDRASLELNEYIQSLNLKLRNIHKEFLLEELPINSKLLMDRLFGLYEEKGKMLLNVFNEHNEKCRQLIGIDYVDITVRRYVNCAKYLRELIQQKFGKEDIALKEFTGEIVRNFEFYLKIEKGCQHNTIIRYMKCLKKITNLGLANEWITKDPFYGIKFKQDEVIKEFLTKDELETVATKEFDIPRLDLVRDVFVFCAFTGLAFIDAANLKPEHIIKDNEGCLWVRIARQKTNNMCNIPLLDIPQQILNKYKDHPLCQKRNVLIPVPSNQKMNSYLKEIADFCGIKKNITTHCARHTAATVVFLANGVSLENVAKMLGHSDTRMTKHYAKVLDSSIKRDMEKVKMEFSFSKTEEAI